MGDDQQYPSGRFGGDMSRNEVEMDLSKFMEMLQENAALKDKIRTLEDVKNDNPFQKFIFVAQAIDAWRIIPRAFLAVYMYLLYFTTFWFMDLPEPSLIVPSRIIFLITCASSLFLKTLSTSLIGRPPKSDTIFPLESSTILKVSKVASML